MPSVCRTTAPAARRFANDVKGEALYMMELVLSLEKLNFHKLRLLHDIACKHDDAEMADFIGARAPLPSGFSLFHSFSFFFLVLNPHV